MLALKKLVIKTATDTVGSLIVSHLFAKVMETIRDGRQVSVKSDDTIHRDGSATLTVDFEDYSVKVNTNAQTKSSYVYITHTVWAMNNKHGDPYGFNMQSEILEVFFGQKLIEQMSELEMKVLDGIRAVQEQQPRNN